LRVVATDLSLVERPRDRRQRCERHLHDGAIAITQVGSFINNYFWRVRTNLKGTLIKLGIVAAMGLLVFAAACGGDDDDDGNDSTPASQATSASTSTATVAEDPTTAPDDGDGNSGQQQFSEMSADVQDGVNGLCSVAADPVAGLSSGINLDIALQAALAGEYGPDFPGPAESFKDAYAGTDPAAFDAAAADMLAVCEDIGWTAQ
jgi:hypothetical protein